MPACAKEGTIGAAVQIEAEPPGRQGAVRPAGPDAPGVARLRPRDAATVIVIDRAGPLPRVLMGRRSARHVFMPSKLVFPGGRTDPGDARVRPGDDLEAEDLDKLVAGPPAVTPARARAIALSAIREACEEAGLFIGRKAAFATAVPAWREFSTNGIAPSLKPMRLLARAVTPPGAVRRFDTRFFTVFRDEVALEKPDFGSGCELEALDWLTLDEARAADVPGITRVILNELDARLGRDPRMRPGAAVPHFRRVGTTYRRDLF